MTDDEIGAALGAGWHVSHGEWWNPADQKYRIAVDHESVELIHGGDSVRFSAPSVEAALAVVALLVAAEQVAAGRPLQLSDLSDAATWVSRSAPSDAKAPR